jgi:hypothetical protein
VKRGLKLLKKDPALGHSVYCINERHQQIQQELPRGKLRYHRERENHHEEIGLLGENPRASPIVENLAETGRIWQGRNNGLIMRKKKRVIRKKANAYLLKRFLPWSLPHQK